jgi:hypothetical protein
MNVRCTVTLTNAKELALAGKPQALNSAASRSENRQFEIANYLEGLLRPITT